jgi:hypothetical protein
MSGHNGKNLETELDTEKADQYNQHLEQTQAATYKLYNPLAGVSPETLRTNVDTFCRDFDLQDHVSVFQKGAMLAQSPHDYARIPDLSTYDLEALEKAASNKWAHPFMLYFSGKSGE